MKKIMLSFSSEKVGNAINSAVDRSFYVVPNVNMDAMLEEGMNQADILMLEVSRAPGYQYPERMALAKRLKKIGKKVVFLCDEKLEESLLIPMLKHEGIIDLFLYNSVTHRSLISSINSL